MPEVRLTGQLVCATEHESRLVLQHLPAHIELTIVEPGCLFFAVERTGDPLIWAVEERFTGEAAFNAHRVRVLASEWGRATAGIERRYAVDGVAS